jgi:hypothetical protein
MLQGNRRDGLHKVKHTKGVSWDQTFVFLITCINYQIWLHHKVIWGPCALGNAIYSGCRLKDVLESIGVTSKIKNLGKLHVAFESVEKVITFTKIKRNSLLIYLRYQVWRRYLLWIFYSIVKSTVSRFNHLGCIKSVVLIHMLIPVMNLETFY